MQLDSSSAMHNLSATSSPYTCANSCTYTNPHARTNTQPNTWRLQVMVLFKPRTLVKKMHVGQVYRMFFVSSDPRAHTGAHTNPHARANT